MTSGRPATLVARWHMLSDGAAWSWVRATGYGGQGAKGLSGIAQVLREYYSISWESDSGG